MDEEKRRAYQDRFQARIREWEAKLDQLAARTRRAEADLRIRLADDESDLRRKIDEARARLREMQMAASGDGWDEIRSGAERIWSDVRDAWNRSAAREDGNDDAGAGDAGDDDSDLDDDGNSAVAR